MNPVLERLPAGGRIAVIRVRSLGDCVLTTPALQILKQHRPDLKLVVVVEPRFAAVFEGNPDVDRTLNPSPLEVAAFRPDLVVNLHGGSRSIALTIASMARYRAGFQHFRARWIYNTVLPRAQEILRTERKVHTAEHLASAMFHLGVPPCEIPRARLFANAHPSQAPYAVIHPFASARDKAWPVDRFVAAAQHLRADFDLDPVILCGPHDNPAPFAAFNTVRNAPLGEVKSMLGSAQLFLGNDSGPAHMACAFGVPLVVLYGPSDPVVWAPWKPAAAECLIRPSLEQIGVQDVLSAVDRLKVRA